MIENQFLIRTTNFDFKVNKLMHPAKCCGSVLSWYPRQGVDLNMRGNFFFYKMTSFISKPNTSKNMKMESTLDSYIKFNIDLFTVCILLKTVFFPLQNEFKFCNLDQNSITPGVVGKIVSYFFFFLNKPILPMECINSRMFLPLYPIKRMGNIYRSVTGCYHLQFPCFGI